MRIGILTFHRAINYGAYMQAFSLVTRLKREFPDHSIEIIDYNPRVRERFILKCPVVFFYRRSIAQGIQKMKQTLVFKKSLKELPLGENLVGADNQKVQNYINKTYDLVIVGSDAVFNWNDIGIPNPYFLGDVDKSLKVSYSASAHLQKYLSLDKGDKEYLARCLNSFSYVGVRDNNTFKFASFYLNDQEPQHNCDPSVFLDMSFPEYDLVRKLKKHGFDYTKKTIFIMLMHPEYCQYARKYFGDNCQYVSLMDGNKDADIYLYDLNPFEWAHVFKYGTCLVTDYFHGTIFGLKNLIPVMSIDSSRYQNEHYESKAFDLLNNRLELPEIYVNGDDISGEGGYSVFTQKMDLILNSFDKERINKALEKESESADSFIDALRQILRESR